MLLSDCDAIGTKSGAHVAVANEYDAYETMLPNGVSPSAKAL